MPYIFERLYRGDKSRRETEGSGIGLTIVKKILALHSAAIDVESITGIGTSKVTTLSYDNGKLKIDKEKRSVQVKGEDTILTPNEFDILYTLASNGGKVLSREQLIQNIYGIDFEGYDRTIDAHIKNLRKKIEDNSKSPKYIITVIKAGYKFGVEEDT
ncbi:winged helix-turn-helix domain-containing protein [Clostridium sp. Mt-5]|uniref:histidine kinase n=1 Tax=Clostridium moutaii TaxID=3240932 RepID=A0ABV4BR35_9CLOT